VSTSVLDRPVIDTTTVEDPTVRKPLVLGENDLATVTDKVCSLVESRTPPRAWYIAFAISSALTAVLLAMIGYLFFKGVGVWGLNIPVGWAFDITNFVWWVGIGHAGTLISAILFLFRQKWRTGINRFAEAMTIFAVVCAGIFPGIHVGRPWLIWWVFPLPNTMGVWPNFRSPLLWDVFAVGTYMTVSLMFWYMGMIPDLATLRDRAKTRIRGLIYGLLALGWRSSNRHWHRYEVAYLLLAALATPLVLSVHSVVSFDFATSQVPGWHTTIFPPYFVAGAIFSGFAMVLTLLIPSRQLFGLKEIITMRHLENMAKILMATGMMVGFGYMTEFFIAWYSGSPPERFTFLNRALGPYSWAYWTMITCNVLVPQVFWSKKARTSLAVLLVVSILVNVGMWFERFVIIVTSLSRDYLPSSWGHYRPTWVELLTFAGSIGLFMTLFLLFLRYLPMVAMAEVKSVMPQARLEGGGHRGIGDYYGDIPHQHDVSHCRELLEGKRTTAAGVPGDGGGR
jgi:Ni/Fe-hydrogenase subunit HybB-like protein